MRYSLRSLFAITTVAAVVFAALASLRGCYYVQLRAVDAVLAEYPEIDRVWLSTNDDVTLEVEEVFFTTVSDPNTIYRCRGIDGASKSELRTGLQRALREQRPVALPAYLLEHRRRR